MTVPLPGPRTAASYLAEIAELKASRRNDLRALWAARAEIVDLRHKIWKVRYSRRVLRAELAQARAEVAA